MEREHLQNRDVNRSHEPVGIPLNRPPGTFSPSGGEGQDEGVRFMESHLSFFRMHWGMNPGVAASRQSAAIRGNNSQRRSAETPLRPSSPRTSGICRLPCQGFFQLVQQPGQQRHRHGRERENRPARGVVPGLDRCLAFGIGRITEQK